MRGADAEKRPVTSRVVTFWGAPVLKKGEDSIAAASACAMRLVAAAVAGTTLGILAAEALFVGIA